MKLNLLLGCSLFILLLSPLDIYSQGSKKEKYGDKFYSYYSFGSAIEALKDVDSLSIDGRRKLAESFKRKLQFKDAEQVLRTVILDKNATPYDYYDMYYILRINGKYEESEQWMIKFAEANPFDHRSQNYLKNIDKFNLKILDEGRYSIKNLIINSQQQDFGTAFYNDKIVFSSSRSEVKPIKSTYSWNEMNFLDLYVANIGQNAELVKLKNLDKKLNKKYHEGPASFAKQGTFMAFTKNNYSGQSKEGIIKLQLFFSEYQNGKWQKEVAFKLNNNEYSVGHPWISEDARTMYFATDMPGGFGGVDIYKITKKISGDWGDPVNLGSKVNTEGDEMFPFYSETNSMLFFSSDGQLSFGGLDLFVAKVNEDSIIDVLNMGYPLNSQYDDFAVIMDKNLKKGYFSSNRIGGKGDDDIYYFDMLIPFKFKQQLKGNATDHLGNVLAGEYISICDENGKVIAAGFTDDNGNYSFEVEPDKQYVLKFGKGKYESTKLFNTFTPNPIVISDITITKDPDLKLYCMLTEAQTQQKIEGALFTIVDRKTGKTEFFTSSMTGDFLKNLSDNKIGDTLNYKITIEKEGYMPKSIIYTKILDKEGQYNLNEDLNVSLTKYTVGMDLTKLLEIKPIYFDYDKFNIRPDAALELDVIVKVMNENPSMVIELGSHTDCRGTKEYNEKLSARRAESSADYIKKRIKNPERIYGKGYGESKIINGCECEGSKVSKCSDEEHQMNRRTEFVIVKM
jgi:outer membrane protein OmpA-like peptidoglycan-associated protein